jgi:phage terminase large subunit-like protein
MTTAAVSILHCMQEASLWRGWFHNPATWAAWRTFLAVLFGLPVSDEGLDLYRQCTGRSARPAIGFTEAWLVVGRRGGKSMILALIACFLAVFRDWRPFLTPGEIGTIKIIATDRRQARVIHRYCRALLTKVPAFAELIERETEDEIALNTGVSIEIQSASFRTVRGYTMIACLCDEIAYWRSDETSANPDSEIISALKPAMATIPGAFFLAASELSPNFGDGVKDQAAAWA